jgi:hypothetical protein
MKKTLMALSICLFLFSCVEINKSENEIVGKWIISVNDYDTSWGEYLVINDDGTYCMGDNVGYENVGNWSIKGSDLCSQETGYTGRLEIGQEEEKICGSFNIEGNKLKWILGPNIWTYERSDESKIECTHWDCYIKKLDQDSLRLLTGY